ncbi:hypothetical protein IscW_ISCW013247, partial [Ixodes scapularis]
QHLLGAWQKERSPTMASPGDGAVSGGCGGLDRAGPNPGAVGCAGGAVCLRHRHPPPPGQGEGGHSTRDPQQRRSAALPHGEPAGGTQV